LLFVFGLSALQRCELVLSIAKLQHCATQLPAQAILYRVSLFRRMEQAAAEHRG
jgi:hypothetical protein